MNKIIKISIAGYSFSIDLDAHNLLDNYLKSLTNKYGSSDENEMVNDIEIRICELINDKLASTDSVVTLEIIREIITQIGTVASIERDSYDTQSGVRFNFEKEAKSDHQVAEVMREVKDGVFNVFNCIGRVIVIIFISAFSLLGLMLFIPFVATIIMSGGAFEALPNISVSLLVGSLCVGSIIIVALFYRILDKGRHIFSQWKLIFALFAISTIMGSFGVSGIIDFASNYSSVVSASETQLYSTDNKTVVIVIGDKAAGKNNKKVRIRHRNDFINNIYYAALGRSVPLQYIEMLTNGGSYTDYIDVDVWRRGIKDITVNIESDVYAGSLSEAMKGVKEAYVPKINFSQDTLYVNNVRQVELLKKRPIDIIEVDVIIPKDYKYKVIYR